MVGTLYAFMSSRSYCWQRETKYQPLILGDLLSYGPDLKDIVRRGAVCVDQVLRGAKPADLPVQVPVKFETAVNTKTAKAVGLAVPTSMLLRADEVIE